MRSRRAWIGVGLGAGAWGIHLALGRESALAERFYSRGLFAGWRWIWDHTFGFSPVPWIYLFAAAALMVAGFILYRRLSRPRARSSIPLLNRMGRSAFRTAGWAGILVFLFYALWGFNYNRVGLEKHLGFVPSPLDGMDVLEETSWAGRLAAANRASIPDAGAEALAADALPKYLESEIRDALAQALRKAEYPASGRVRVRNFPGEGWLMRFSSTGIYIPYFSEGYVEAGLLPFERPFTLAHEMAHGYGITDEGGANFLAFLACAESSDPVVRYSGYAAYWVYAAGELPRVEFKKMWADVPEGMKADLQAAEKNAARYRGALDKISRKVYAQYLKSQGIQEGLRSYSRLVGLVVAWKRSGRLI